MRIEPLNNSQLYWSVRPLFYLMKRMFGRELTPYRVMAYRPKVIWAASLLTQALSSSKPVSPKLKSLMSIRAAQMVGCPF
jgi:alkylhydroperoxidase family enzyme